MTGERNPRAVLRDVMQAATAAKVATAPRLLLVAMWARLNPARPWQDWPLTVLADDAGFSYRHALEHLAALERAGLVQLQRRPGRASLWRLTLRAALAEVVDDAGPLTESSQDPRRNRQGTPDGIVTGTPDGIVTTTGHSRPPTGASTGAPALPPLRVIAAQERDRLRAATLPGIDDLEPNRAERRRRQRAMANRATAWRSKQVAR